MTSRVQLRRIALQVLVAAALTLALAFGRPELAAAHTGDDAAFKHVFIEFALWGIGLAAVLALLVAVFWMRARLLRRSG